MNRPARYARAVPRLRALKARLLPRETLREVALSPSYEEALTLLRDTPYQGLTTASSPSTIQTVALRVFYERASSARKMLPPEAHLLVDAFTREEEARDVLAILRSIYEGRTLPYLPTASIQGTLPSRIKRDPDILVSTQRLSEFLDKTWMKPYARTALKLAQEARSPEPITWASLPAALGEYASALARFRGADRRGLESILCPYLEYKAAAALVNAKAIGVPIRAIARLLEGQEACRIPWQELRQIYEREPGPQEVLYSARELLPTLKIDTKLPYAQALEQARKEALAKSGKAARAAFGGYPFTPVLAAAILMLAKIEMLNITTILTGIKLKLKPDEISELIITY